MSLLKRLVAVPISQEGNGDSVSSGKRTHTGTCLPATLRAFFLTTSMHSSNHTMSTAVSPYVWPASGSRPQI